MAKKEKGKRKINWAFTLFACIMTAVIVYLAIGLGNNGAKIVSPFRLSNDTSETYDLIGYFETQGVSGTQEEYAWTRRDTIVLYNNGTFYAYPFFEGKYPGNVGPRVGSYAIDGNTLRLFYLFEGSGSIRATVVFETKEFKIESGDKFSNDDATYTRISESTYKTYYKEDIEINDLFKDFINNSVIETEGSKKY